MIDPSPANLTIVYDGECPFCTNYVRLMALQKVAGSVRLIDARDGGGEVDNIHRAGFDLNEGMVAFYGDRVYYGRDAVVLLSVLGNSTGVPARLIGALLRSPRRAAFLYPIMKLGRRVTLKALGRKPIEAGAADGIKSASN